MFAWVHMSTGDIIGNVVILLLFALWLGLLAEIGRRRP